MIRDGEVEPGLYRVTTHAGAILDVQVTGVDRRDQADYLVYLPNVPVNPDRAITVDSKLPVGDIHIITDDHGGVWRLRGGTKIAGIEVVPVDEVDRLRDQHAAGSPFSTPEVVPPEAQIRPQTADSDSAGILTSADIGRGVDARQKSDSAADEPVVESDPKADAPAATGAALESSPQPEPEQAARAEDRPEASPRSEHLFEDQYQPVVEAAASPGPGDTATATETLTVAEDAAP